MSGLIGDNWILLSASAFNLLLHVVLVEVYEENLASHKYTVGKGRNILIDKQCLSFTTKVVLTS